MTATAVPPTATGTTAARPGGSLWSVVEYRLIGLRAWWVTVLVTGVVTPLVFVLALGVGLGTLVDDNGSSLGVSYLAFVAPALLAATALQTATGDASFPIMQGFKWQRVFHGMAATPLSPRQIADGNLVGILLRQLANCTLFLAIIALVGGTERWEVLLAVPAATLGGCAFAAPVMALAATVSSEGQAFNVLFRFGVTPMFLFSGTFYPIDRLPAWGQVLAWVSPLWHSTELARGAAIGRLGAGAALGHVAYLLVWLVVGVVLARWRFRVKVEA